ncbi:MULTISPECIES: 2-oxo acid dehydrogenase subunit E2 [Halomicrobium]|uniref:Catalytic domain of components of various dehydrogenase complexes n=2 Tax=Halomicrobium mukohataei TaxID=57705 RepID=C7NZC2_HALMD|nr:MULTISPECIES: 2-oxo acid dehydrogenase subunit E2 [Halomicrobium]ACV46808.1 catalytic domain of components of various dehydrogenase complexes [Halomicrobium mukohataei DSM 12286]QCD65311.1 2-oxo acid dehydrogenase subunit E2 [Halomicrobium mukohataei]QFR20117.1 2-oxo acid dehydrogenase subunit E2 [Halomicrobium sp. ZPS1]
MFEFELPDLGEGVAEGEILAWHVEPGDRVEEDQVLAEVETDKAAVDVPSPVAGVVRELHYEPGDMVETGAVVVSIATDEADDETDDETDEEAATTAVTDESADSEPSATGGRVFAPPNVRRLARELGVEITAVDGSGPSGRITESDVRAAGEDAASADDAEVESAVSRVDDGDGSGVKSAVRRVDDGDEADDEPVVNSAVAAVDSDAERDRSLATPATRKLASDLGVDIDAVPTDESRDGEPYVDEAAVRAFAASADETERERAAGSTGRAGEPSTADGASGEAASAEGQRREPYQGVRRTIGQRMAESRREIPHATHHDRAVVAGLVDAHERLEPLAEERGVDLTYTPLLLKCVAAALREHPILNSELDAEAEEIVYHDRVDLGVAAATDHGLVVPVVERVDEKGLLAIAREVNDLVARARDRDLAREEMQGGTFTVTNFGAIGGEYADPIINAPQTAILGTGALKERPVAEDGETRAQRGSPNGERGAQRPASGEVVARATLPLSLAIDHRVIDGADAARFVNTLKEYLAEPSLLLLE